MHLIVHTDGGARGNPGPAAVGVVIQEEAARLPVPEHSDGGQGDRGHETRKTVMEFGKCIGEATNNVAEYAAVIEALKFIKTYQVSGVTYHDTDKLQIQFFLDSTLVVNQLNGLFKVKDARLRELLAGARILEQEIAADIRYFVVPREQNFRADYFVNKALDAKPV